VTVTRAKRRPGAHTVLPAFALAAAAALASGGCVTARSHFVDTPVSERLDPLPPGPPAWSVTDRRIPGATLLVVEHWHECRAARHAVVDRTAVTVREPPVPLTAAYYFLGVTALASGVTLLGVALSRDPATRGAGDVASAAAVTAGGSGLLGVAMGLSIAARDTRRHLGSTELESIERWPCDVAPAAGVAVELLAAPAGAAVDRGMTDPAGRWMRADAEAVSATTARVEGAPAGAVDLTGLRCGAAERERLDAFLAAADAALAPAGYVPAAHHLGHGASERLVTTPGALHAVLVTPGDAPAPLDGDGVSSVVAPFLAALAERHGVALAGLTRAAPASPRDSWRLRLGAGGCQLLLVYAKGG
jgi:hypothetical protein